MNDPSPDDLERAHERVDALAQHVDTVPAWNAIERAIDRGPRASTRRMLQVAAAVAAAVVIAGAVAYAMRSDSGKSSVEVVEPTPTTSPRDCELPALGSDPGGPATSALQGGAARAPFTLDDGKLQVTPPRPDDTPKVTAGQAECAALASGSPHGFTMLDLASRYGGAAVGYGRVTVDPALVADAQKPTSPFSDINDNTQPTLPDAAQYQQRLAWLVVVKNIEIFHGPPGYTEPEIPASSHRYLVFLIDAQTGSDALLYSETQSTPAAVSVPAERVSVPWTLVSRSPNGYTGTIRATVLPCDGYPNPVNVDRDRAAVRVIVERPVNASCGAQKEVTLALHAAVVTANIPEQLAHDPLGPDVIIESSAATKPPGDTGGVLRMVREADNGTTIEISVGSVLAVGPLHVSEHYAADKTQSSDPTVLGLIGGAGDSELGEFRAWRAGHADLAVYANGCNLGESNGVECTPLWIVHVTVK